MLDALVVVGQTTREHLVALVNADPVPVEAALSRLERLLLAWETPGGLRAISGVADSLRGDDSLGVSGLQPVSPHAENPDRIACHLAALSPAATAMLSHVTDQGGQAATGPVRGCAPEEASTPQEELVARRLLRLDDQGNAVVPGEVGLALRGGHTTREPIGSVPQVAVTTRGEDLVERAAAGAAFETVRRVELLLDMWGTRPAAMLRSGGLGVRELRSLATALHLDEAGAAFIVEITRAAGLLAEGTTGNGDPVWLPTDAFDKWVELPPADRWLALAASWLRTERVPGLIGTRDRTGKARNALTAELTHPLAPQTRQMTLTALAELPAGSCLAAGTGLPSLVAALRWVRPRRPPVRDQLVAWTVQEAAWLGMTGLDALSSGARELLAGAEDRAVASVGAHLPSPVDHLLLQADLTAVAPGPLVTDLDRSVHLMADVESRGGATVHRFSRESLRRAFDAGWSAGDVHEFLTRVSATPVPQSLSYLVDDVARTFGSIRVGHAEAFLRTDDEAALTELMHDPRAHGLGLRRIAPTVLIATSPLEVLLPRLRELGAAPVVEGPDGVVRVARPDLLRARPARGSRSSAVEAARSSALVAAVLSAVRAGDEAAANAPSRADRATSPAAALTMLREAVETGAPVVVTYVDDQGGSSQRVLEPVRVEGGQLLATDRRSGDRRSFAVHRITAVAPAPQR